MTGVQTCALPICFPVTIQPVMHRCKVDFHAFFVPNRLLWENFEKFQAYDTLNDIPVHPYIDAGNIDCNPDLKIEAGSLMDYLDVPTTNTDVAIGFYS